MATIELIYDRDCPNIPRARENLIRALGIAGSALQWREWDRADAATPNYARAYGSPTILVNRRDVAGAPAVDGSSCRIYINDRGARQGVPPVEMIVSALRSQPNKVAGQNTLSFLPAIGIALMPKLTCPVCWPAYTALLSAMGVGFVNYTPYLLPLTALFLLLALGSLGWRAHTRRGYGPLLLGLLASAMILIGKFQFDSDITTYIGVAVLIGASVWNAWPRRLAAAPCPACIPGGEPGSPVTLEGGKS